MRPVHWLFLVSAALFVCSLGFLVTTSAAARHAPAPAPPSFTPVASVKQLMNGVIAPAATVVYQSVGTVVSSAGIEEIAPRTDQEWEMVGSSAAALAESGGLLIAEGRAVDRQQWTTMSKALTDAAMAALRAAEARDPEAVLAAGAILNESCDACHQVYWRQ
jgi:hypothetical protein